MATQLTFEGVYRSLRRPSTTMKTWTSNPRPLVRFMAGLGVDGITVLGVLERPIALLDSERAELIRTAVAAAGAMPVIVGAAIAARAPRRSLRQMAENLGAKP